MSIGMTPFRALYGYDSLTFMEKIFGEYNMVDMEKHWIQESQDILWVLKDNL
jgi:hypothetical protein